MAFFTVMEIVDILVIIAAAGFIFKDTLRPAMPRVDYTADPVAYYRAMGQGKGRMNQFWFAAAVIAPAILLHELGHKFVAMSYGLDATLHASYVWLGIAVALRLLNFPFIFFVPAFVAFPSVTTAGQSALIAFAGPAVNLLLWLGALWAFKAKVTKDRTWLSILRLTATVNMILFIINMIPIPPFDGGHGFTALWHVVAG